MQVGISPEQMEASPYQAADADASYVAKVMLPALPGPAELHAKLLGLQPNGILSDSERREAITRQIHFLVGRFFVLLESEDE